MNKKNISLLIIVLFICRLSHASELLILEKEDSGIKVSVSLSNIRKINKEYFCYLGDEIYVNVRIKNTTNNTLYVPEKEHCLSVELVKRNAQHGHGLLKTKFNVYKINQGDSIKVTEKIKALAPSINRLKLKLRNTRAKANKARILTFNDGIWKPGSSYVNIDSDNLWEGSICSTYKLNIKNKVPDQIEHVYYEAIRFIRRFDENGPLISKKTNRKPFYSQEIMKDVSSGEFSYNLLYINTIASGEHKIAIDLLWKIFYETQKNSPSHIYCFSHICNLFSKGLGVEYTEQILNVAEASKKKEAVSTRILAMHMAALLMENDYIVCTLRNNFYIHDVDKNHKKRAESILRYLEKDSLTDIRKKAKQLLGKKVDKDEIGKRKYIKNE